MCLNVSSRNLHIPDFFSRSLVFTKNSPLTPAFRAGLALLREKSLLERYFRRWLGNDLKDMSAEEGTTALGLGQVATSLVALMGMIFVAALVLCIELLVRHLLLESGRT